ncbi:MAG: sodium/proton antiporter NhaB [Desulfobulbus sp.]|nr:sodium/proton antiporter NhaB [Desulfobulbus sp.]
MFWSYPLAFARNFLGKAPLWYKLVILLFLAANPILLKVCGPFITGWALIGEFIFTLAMALKCYPLPAGGLLALEAVAIGMTKPGTVLQEALANFDVILLLIFMVAGIFFMKDFLRFTFAHFLVKVRSKETISLLFCGTGAFLSAFLDALTVTAVIVAVAYGFYDIYHRYRSGKDGGGAVHDLTSDLALKVQEQEDLKQFRGFLRNLVMHASVGTALGGMCTLVGEPQNLLVGNVMGWQFATFFFKVAPVSLPVLVVGLATCYCVEKKKWFTYGFELPRHIRSYLLETEVQMAAKRGPQGALRLAVQAVAGIWLIVALAFHLAAVGLIGLSVIVFLTACNGITEEHRIGPAFEEALPFTALLVVFFAIVAVIHDQHLFTPVINYALSFQGQAQLAVYYLVNGVLSAISDNVFVATIFISESKTHMVDMLAAIPGLGMTGQELMQKLTDPHTPRTDVLVTLPQTSAVQVKAVIDQFDKLAVAINTGTNIPSIATPNGQAAFLFLLTSALAPVIRLSYGSMVWLALPYTLTMSLTGLMATYLFL